MVQTTSRHGAFRVATLLLVVLVGELTQVRASEFLAPPTYTDAAEGEMDAQAEQALLTQLETALGPKHRSFTERRLAHLIQVLQPTVDALPKNAFGKLDIPAVSYALRRLFLERHAWFVKGLEPPSHSYAAWEESNPLEMLGSEFSQEAKSVLEEHLSKGLGLHEIAVLAATLEHLVHQQEMSRLQYAYAANDFSIEDVVTPEEATKIIDFHMGLLMSGRLPNGTSPGEQLAVKEEVSQLSSKFPFYPQTLKFAHDVQYRVQPQRDYLYYTEMQAIVEEIGDTFGRWQNSECMDLKNNLVKLEDTSAGGSGRVRLADFYSAALNDGHWEFAESYQYLKKFGALDDSNPQNLRVIIPNYVGGPSNCVASTSYFSICCIDECGALFSSLEAAVRAPRERPAELLRLVGGLASATSPSNRTLAPWLHRRLRDIAAKHGGVVPLHSRLFAQWMHYAYPRECPYPHALGETQAIDALAFEKETRTKFGLGPDDMQTFIQESKTNNTRDTQQDEELEQAMWIPLEELVVKNTPAPSFSERYGGLGHRNIAFLLAIVSTSLIILQFLKSGMAYLDSGAIEKRMV